VHVSRAAAEQIGQARSVGHEAAGNYIVPILKNARQPVVLVDAVVHVPVAEADLDPAEFGVSRLDAAFEDLPVQASSSTPIFKTSTLGTVFPSRFSWNRLIFFEHEEEFDTPQTFGMKGRMLDCQKFRETVDGGADFARLCGFSLLPKYLGCRVRHQRVMQKKHRYG